LPPPLCLKHCRLFMCPQDRSFLEWRVWMDLWLKQCERTEASVQTLWQTLRFVEIGNRNLARPESLVIKSKLYGSTGRGGFGLGKDWISGRTGICQMLD
jgi:hypothetical protein